MQVLLAYDSPLRNILTCEGTIPLPRHSLTYTRERTALGIGTVVVLLELQWKTWASKPPRKTKTLKKIYSFTTRLRRFKW